MSMSIDEFYRPLPAIVFTAKRRAGKDLAAQIVFDMGFDTKRVAFGDPLREKFHDLFPHIPRMPKPVEHYQLFGQAMRQIDPDIWVKLTIGRLMVEEQMLKAAGLRPYSYIFTDVRQWNEYEACKKLGAVIVRIEVSPELRIKRMIELGESVTPESLNAGTELVMEDFPVDFTITNNGTEEDFKQELTELIYQIQKGRAAHGKEEES